MNQKRLPLRTLAIIACSAAIVVASTQDSKRSADEILKEVDSLKTPAIPQNRGDQAAVREFLRKRQEVQQKKAALALELYKVAPDNKRVPELMTERWRSLPPTELEKEVDEVLAHVKSDALAAEASFIRINLAVAQGRSDDLAEKVGPEIEKFLKLAPNDQRAGSLLYFMANQATDEATKQKYEDRLMELPNSPYVEMIKDSRWRREQIGKPLKLEFADAIKGTTVSIEALKGKVVVIDFWATWCGPCVAEMPNMKKLYAEYKDRGVEFIGVSLDQPKEQGGLDSLKKFVAEKEITWPQYYQGEGWKGEFSTSWRIKSIPCVFVVDQEGKLFSVDARGKLETLIPQLLKQKSEGASGG